MQKKTPTAEIKRYWERLSNEIGCVISGQTPATIHHCHGGSMVARGVYTGMSQKSSDWLVIPLCAEFHTGNRGIDNGMGLFKGVKAWEKEYGEQATFLDVLSQQIRIDVWEMAGIEPRR